MFFYALLHLVWIVASIVGGLLVWKQYKNLSGFFFFLVTLFGSSWFLGYYLFFLNIFSQHVNLMISRFTFCTGVLATLSLCLFAYFFNSKQNNIERICYSIWMIFFWIFSIYIFSDKMIFWLKMDNFTGVYREVYWSWFILHYVLYATLIPLLWIVISLKIKTLYFLQKIRFKWIIFSTFLLILLLLFFQLILPYFWIWIFEKWLIIVFFIYVLYVLYTIKRYYFSPLHQEYWFIKVWVVAWSMIMSIVTLHVIKYYYFRVITQGSSFWNIWDEFNIIDSSIVIIGYSMFHYLLKKIFLTNDSEQKIKQNIENLKQSISDTTTLEHLNKILQWGIRKICKTNSSKVILFENKEELSQLKKYFSNSLREKIFINDVVFIEENKRKFNKDLILKEIDKDTMLVFPIMNSQWKIVWLYFIWKKIFWDFYTVHEIKILSSLVKFIGIHLKYLSTYIKIQDYSLQLDQRIDDKTIEYNNLINKQKEFISMISHEIRSPIGSTIFQIDSLIDEIDKNKITTVAIKKNVKNIGDQLIQIGELLKKLFSIQYFDTRNVVLLKEKIHIWALLEKEYEMYTRMYEHITFILRISPDLGFVNIDKIHFQQVLINLLENAIKFANVWDPVILIECSKEDWDIFRINIEDNGAWYWDIDSSSIFEKYTKWNHAKLWLWMWLYLCKRIITMHDGTITVSHGKILNGASFVIELPV